MHKKPAGLPLSHTVFAALLGLCLSVTATVATAADSLAANPVPTGQAVPSAKPTCGASASVIGRSEATAAARTESASGARAEPAWHTWHQGLASWYGKAFQNLRTASGERFDMNELTAAHPSLPFGTRIKVRNPDNGRTVVVRVNDRGPFTGNRSIDLSRAAASALGLLQRGAGQVEMLLLNAGSALPSLPRPNLALPSVALPNLSLPTLSLPGVSSPPTPGAQGLVGPSGPLASVNDCVDR